MIYSEMKKLALNGAAEDVKALLSIYGESTFTIDFNTTKCSILIADWVFASNRDKTEKLALVSDYKNKSGTFADTQETSPDVLQMLREIRDNVADLTRQVQELKEGTATRDVVKEMRGAIQSTAKRAQAPGQL